MTGRSKQPEVAAKAGPVRQTFIAPTATTAPEPSAEKLRGRVGRGFLTIRPTARLDPAPPALYPIAYLTYSTSLSSSPTSRSSISPKVFSPPYIMYLRRAWVKC